MLLIMNSSEIIMERKNKLINIRIQICNVVRCLLAFYSTGKLTFFIEYIPSPFITLPFIILICLGVFADVKHTQLQARLLCLIEIVFKDIAKCSCVSIILNMTPKKLFVIRSN